MYLEASMLQVKEGIEEDYEEAFRGASEIISSFNERLHSSRITALYRSKSEIFSTSSMGNIRRPYC